MSDYPAKWWHWTEDDKIACDLCPRACIVKPGQRAFCFVRKGTEQGMTLTTYGRSSGYCIDPIEKKPLNHFYPGSPVLSFGTAGCNLGCKFCQNWDISKSRDFDRLSDEAYPEAIARAAVATRSRSVAFTYNDPTIFAEYAIDTARACREAGIHTVAVSAGYINPEPRAEFYEVIDAVNIDFKAFTEKFYWELTGTHLKDVLETLQYVVNQTDTWVEMTTLLIPGKNDSPEELAAQCRWIRDYLGPDVPLHYSAFHPDYKMMDVPATPAETLTTARQIALEHGLNYVYTGNIHDADGGSTYCPMCNEMLIERDWYELGKYNIKDGKCGACGTEIAGHFENHAGDWGRRRMSVDMLRYTEN